MQVAKDYRLARVSGPLTYNDITTASSEGRRDIWTERERGWDEAEAIDTGQNRAVCRRFDPICSVFVNFMYSFYERKNKVAPHK